MTRILLTSVCVVLLSTMALAETKSAVKRTKSSIVNLDKTIAELGSPLYRVREAATERLAKLGRAAKPQLTKIAKHEDVEVRCRAMHLLAMLESPYVLPGPLGANSSSPYGSTSYSSSSPFGATSYGTISLPSYAPAPAAFGYRSTTPSSASVIIYYPPAPSYRTPPPVSGIIFAPVVEPTLPVQPPPPSPPSTPR